MSQERTFNKLAGAPLKTKLDHIEVSMRDYEDIGPRDCGFELTDFDPSNIAELKAWAMQTYMTGEEELEYMFGWLNGRPVINMLAVMDDGVIQAQFDFSTPLDRYWEDALNMYLVPYKSEDGDYSEIRNKYLNK